MRGSGQTRAAVKAALLLWVVAMFQLPAVGRAEPPAASRSRFAALWTGEIAYSEPELLALGKDADPVARQFACMRLAELDPPSEAALAALVQALGDPVDSVRFQALAGLMRIGRPATRVLAEALSDFQSIGTLTDYGETRTVSRSDLAFTALVHAQDVDVVALLAVYRSAPPETTASGFESTPEHPKIASPRQRIRMVFEQGCIMSRAEIGAADAVTALAETVAGDATMREAAAQALAKIPESGTQALHNLLGHPNSQVRSVTLAAYPASAKESSELVASLLKDPEREVRRTALDRIRRPKWTWWWSADLSCRHAPIGQSSALLTGLPASVLPEVVVLARDTDATTREAAVEALGSLGSARPDLTPAVAEALVPMLSDPVADVAYSAVSELDTLTRLNVVSWPDVLARLSLSETRRKEAIDAFVTVCLLDNGRACHHVKEFLSASPDWGEAVAKALIARYPDVLDDQALGAFEALDAKGPAYARELERLLDHPKESVRTKAAVALAKRGYTPARVWQVLEEGVRSLEAYPTGSAEALAGLGEEGITRLIGIAQDPATPKRIRRELISTLARVAAQSSQAADAILSAAADSTDPGVQESAVWALHSLKTRADEVPTVLEAVFSTGSGEVRRTVVSSWESFGLAPGDFVARVFADSVPEVRKEGFKLLLLLPKDDPRRLAFTAAALRDKDERVRDNGLEFAGKLGNQGEALLAQYAAGGEPLTSGFFYGVERLGSFGGTLVTALEARAADAPSEVRNRIIDMLGRAGTEAPVDRESLYAQLEASEPADREHAANALWSLQEDPWARGGLVATVLMEAEIRRISDWRLRYAFHLLEPSSHPLGDGEDLPEFPWPPPPGYKLKAVPRELLAASTTTTFGDVYKRLVDALESASHGFEHFLFRGPADGFTLAARMERIERDGTPLPEPARWTKEGSPKLSLGDLLGDLFFEKPGYFRVIVFAVTDDLVPGQNPGARLPEPEEVAAGMPPELARRLFAGKEVLALVYSFERQRDAKIMPQLWDGAPSARQHLERAGIWTRLEEGSRH